MLVIRTGFITLVGMFSLAGCTTPPSTQPNPARQVVDEQILRLAAEVRQAQSDLYQAGALDQVTPKAPLALASDEQPVTISWQGDALQLLSKLSHERGLSFSFIGVRLPLPVNVDVTDVPLSEVLDNVRAQIGYRADLTRQDDKLVLQYQRPRS